MTESLISKLKILAAIPCYNEDRFIGSLVLKARAFADQVLVIDDGSTDRTAEIAKAAGASVIRHKTNEGKGMATNTAFQWARKSGAQALVLLDGDGQHEPSQIPIVVKPVLAGMADIVVGSRFHSKKNNVPAYRIIGQRILTVVANLGSGIKLTDAMSGFRAFSPKAIETLSFSGKGAGNPECEMQFLINESHLKVIEVPVTANYKEKAKRNPIAQGIAFLNTILSLISKRRPLLFFGLPGFILMVIGLIAGTRVLQIISVEGELAVGTALISVLFLTIGVFSIFTGVILNLLTRRRD